MISYPSCGSLQEPHDGFFLINRNRLEGVVKKLQYAIQTTFQYDTNGNQLKEVNKKDINGTLRDVTTDYVYDRANRITNVTISDGLSTKRIANYYNGDGQRIKQDDDGYITKYYYDDGNLLFTADANNAKATENILDPYGVIVASKRFDGNYANMYYFYNYDEFGQTKETGDALFKNDVKFTGAVHDQSSNLYYMNARFYNPSTGRFLTQDSYKGNAYEPWTQHLYVYTGNNPVNYVDPTGHRAIYAFDPDAETDEQRETSLWAMHGYSSSDSNQIANAKTQDKKVKSIKTARKNKVAREEEQRKTIELSQKLQVATTVVSRATSAAGVVTNSASKFTREWIVLGKGLEKQFPYQALGKASIGVALSGAAFIFQEMAIDADPYTTQWQKEALHQSNLGFTLIGIGAGLLVSLIPGVGVALLVGTVVAASLIVAQTVYEQKTIYNKR